MRQRCTNPNDSSYHNYGGRGVTVCARWDNVDDGFQNFLSDMGRRPSRRHSLERIDTNGNYEPGNCCWATAKEQANNTRRNRRFEYKGQQFTISQLAELAGIQRGTMRFRLVELGLSVEEAVQPTDRRFSRQSRRLADS